MSEIKILELSLRNFKGIKAFKAIANGGNIDIYGDNATGKTTIMDAFIWILFDKDSSNSSNFNVKTLDQEGKPIHMLEHEVVVLLDIDGHQVELQKIYKERWTKKKGQSEAELTGHPTDYFINGVPKKLEEYKAYLQQIVPEETFKVLTNPLYFNKALNWKNRRNIVLGICNDVTQDEIFEENVDLLPIKVLLKDKSIDDLKAEMAARRKKLNEELKSIPYRIDELSRELAEKIDIAALTREKIEFNTKLNDLKNFKGVDYDFRLRSIRGTITFLENELKRLDQELTQGLREQLNKITEVRFTSYSELMDVKSNLQHSQMRFKELAEQKVTINNAMQDLRDDFKEASDSIFPEGSTICPTCKQSLPSDEIDAHKTNFEIDKKATMDYINSQGKKMKAQLTEIESDILLAEAESNRNTEIVEKYQAELIDLDTKMNSIKMLLGSINANETKEYKEIQSKITEIRTQEKEVLELQNNQSDNSGALKELQDKIDYINKQLAKMDLNKDNEKRVQELKTRERDLAGMVADAEKIEFLCDQYVITKASLLEDKLNSKFMIVKFKLFDIQVNGGISETFVTTVDGVPFEDLNNAMKINAGLDIITTLSKHYDLIAPIFLDNRESVNRIPEMDAQIINLIVSKDSKLRVEVE